MGRKEKERQGMERRYVRRREVGRVCVREGERVSQMKKERRKRERNLGRGKESQEWREKKDQKSKRETVR